MKRCSPGSAEHAAQLRHRLVEVVLLDNDVRPNGSSNSSFVRSWPARSTRYCSASKSLGVREIGCPSVPDSTRRWASRRDPSNTYTGRRMGSVTTAEPLSVRLLPLGSRGRSRKFYAQRARFRKTSEHSTFRPRPSRPGGAISARPEIDYSSQCREEQPAQPHRLHGAPIPGGPCLGSRACSFGRASTAAPGSPSWPRSGSRILQAARVRIAGVHTRASAC